MTKTKLILSAVCVCGLIYFTTGCNCAKTKSDVSAATTEKQVLSDSAKTEDTSVQVIAYYFHRTMRCPTCRAIEANTEKVIRNVYADQIADERVIWMPFNLDQQLGKEMEKEFQVSGSTLVIAQMKDGKCASYKKLEDVWDVYDNPEKLEKYLTDEINQMLN